MWRPVLRMRGALVSTPIRYDNSVPSEQYKIVFYACLRARIGFISFPAHWYAIIVPPVLKVDDSRQYFLQVGESHSVVGLGTVWSV